MVHTGSSVLKEQMEYEPIVGHRLPWNCISLRCSTALWIRLLGRRLGCLPQPLESSLSLPPANNPKVLAAMDNSSLNLSSSQLVMTPSDSNENDAHHQRQQLEKLEDTRYPPQIQLGRYVITTWYSAPYPSEYASSFCRSSSSSSIRTHDFILVILTLLWDR
ncbi:unnamed protein product [Schistosoma mattheei]|uniref:Uncharacterized protein n=1 Tax=Schistosoma mattheei TaxID=31246 RepID=A0A183PC96_9TREM|nr:unnamed protein product [Schistosoma mattheei]